MTLTYSYKYIAYDLTDCEFHTFKTYEEALAYINGIDGSEGFSEEQMNGGAGIAEIKYKTQYIPTELKEDYEKAGEEWPYCDEFDSVGSLKLVENK